MDPEMEDKTLELMVSLPGKFVFHWEGNPRQK